MADVVGRRLLLSASEIQALTGWPSALVQDYLQLQEMLTDVAEEINSGNSQLEALSSQDITGRNNARDISLLKVQLDSLSLSLAKLRAEARARQEVIIAPAPVRRGKAEPLPDRVGPVQMPAASRQRFRDVQAFYPGKGFMLSIEGADTSNPAILHSYNVASAARTAPGEYTITLDVATHQGVPVTDWVPAANLRVGDLTTTFSHRIDALAPNQFVLSVFELGLDTVGGKVTRTAYDLQAGDYVDVMALVSQNNRVPKR